VTASANTATAGTAWTNLAKSPVTNDSTGVFNALGFDISSVTVDAHDATGATVYATVMGFGVAHVYRSIDFGAHWLNVSADLPDAPANALLVDPNDANTVYVAMDTGVYVTQAITTCATANCWSVLGTSLPNAPVTALAAGAQLATGDGRRGMLRASTYGRGIWEQPLLTAVSLAQPAIALSPAALTFAAQQQGTVSAAQTVTVTSTGNAPVTFGSPAIAGDFAETDTCAGVTLAVGLTCSFSVSFAPSATGTRTGLLTVYANVSGGQATVTLTGVGTAPASVVLTPGSLMFAATVVNQTSAGQIISVANTGGTAATLQTPVVTGDFGLTASTCGSTLAAGVSCSVQIAFTPTASGTRTGTLTVTDSVGVQTAPLTGVGQAPATDTLAPPTLTFAQQQIGSASAAQQVTLTNSGDVPLTLINAQVSAGDFAVVNGCGASLPGHATCALSVTFVPTATGTRAGTLTVSDEFRSQTVSLTGVGVAPAGVSLSPVALSFAATGVGLVSGAQAVTLTNNGGLVLDVASVAVSAGFAVASSTCGSTLTAGAACVMQVVFAPGSAGAVTGALTLTDNAPGGSQAVALNGTGVDFTLVASGATTATLVSGGTAGYALLLNSVSGLSGSVALACAGQPAHSTCTVAPATGALGASQSVVVTVATGLSGVYGISPGWALLGLPLVLAVRRRWMRGLVMVVVCCGVVGCGAGREIPGSGSGGGTTGTPTPSGSYNLTVTGTAAGVSHSVGLVLVVQ